MSDWKKYIRAFNRADEQRYQNEIGNEDALYWMETHIPHLECPDKIIEQIYYFRWWTYRKHIKHTGDGYVITEFMPEVPWSGRHNTINAAAGHHIAEGRWMTGGRKYIEDYIRFWLDNKGESHSYSTWLIHAIYEYCQLKNDFSVAAENLDKIVAYYRRWEETHLSKTGLFWSLDDRDAMEYTISGTASDGSCAKGFRPALNSYMAADAAAIAKIAALAGNKVLAREFADKHENLKALINACLWDGEFYKTHGMDEEKEARVAYGKNHPQNARELTGYIPWSFQIPPEGRDAAFARLKSPRSFLTRYGFTTAEQFHKRFLFEVDHECQWNGYIWPFATTQTLNAVIGLLNHYNQSVIDKNDFYQMLLTYAKSHRRVNEAGKTIPWIDEVMHPGDGSWSAREILRRLGWKKELGGYERGKDYNHSTFCDLVLGGLLGISVEKGLPAVKPMIPDSWDYFRVSNLELGGRTYDITFERGGSGRHQKIDIAAKGDNG